MKWNIQQLLLTNLRRSGIPAQKLERQLLAQACEYCGFTEQIQVYHIRALKDLKKYEGREKPTWVHIMAARQRKTLVLCRRC